MFLELIKKIKLSWNFLLDTTVIVFTIFYLSIFKLINLLVYNILLSDKTILEGVVCDTTEKTYNDNNILSGI